MRFRIKVFGLIVLVAVLAAGVAGGLVAWRVDQAAQSSVRTELSAIELMSGQLEHYAESHASWAGVERRASELEAETGERVRLTTVSGRVVADTAANTSTPPSTRQPTMLRPRITANYPGEDEPSSDGDDDTGAVDLPDEYYESVEEVVERIAHLRGKTRIGTCKKNVEADVRTDGEIPDECEGVDQTSDSERRDDVEAAETCMSDVDDPYVDRKFEAGCQYQVIEHRTSDISPEPLLLYVGTQKQFQVTYPAAQLTVLGLLIFGLVVVVSALLSRRVLRPIDTLITASRALSAGNLRTRVSIRGHDELTELGRNFNRMVASLESAERQRRQLIADSAHELRTPLSNIHGYLEAFADGVLPADPEYIESLREESQLLARIIDDLRLLALSDAGQLPCDRVRLDAAVLLRGSRSAHQAAAESAEVRLRIEAPAGRAPVMIDADPNRMRQALGNLVGNALHVTPPHGTVTLRTFATAGTAVIEVRDTGGGIDAEHLPRIFDRFWRADPSRNRRTGGSGLGLAIVREIVAAHDGEISARNTEGGAVFTITLPLAG